MARNTTAAGGAKGHSPVRVEPSPALQRIAVPACAVALAIVAAATIDGMRSQPAPAIAAAAVALLAAPPEPAASPRSGTLRCREKWPR